MKIKLGQKLFSPAFTLVTVEDGDSEWVVREVELFYDPGYTRCMSDGNPIDAFDERQQAKILAALFAHADEERNLNQVLKRTAVLS